MDGSRFDDLVKQLAGTQSRRRALRSMLAGVAGGAAGAVGLGGADAGSCRAPAQICRKNGDCCSGKCGSPNNTGRRYCECVTPADCPATGTGCVEATCTNGVCGTQNACDVDEVCYQKACCEPISDQELCETNCGLETNNCGQTVDCGPCCTPVGEACAEDLECCTLSCSGGVCVCNNDDDCPANQLCCDGACQSCCFDGDCPAAGSDCKFVECIDGTCTTFDHDAGEDCAENGGNVCDGAGTCIQCLVPSDCPGTSTECRTITCVNNVCGHTDAPANTELSNQTVGDCVTVVCDGSGGTQLITDSNDTPIPVNECRDYFCAGDQAESEAKNAGEPCTGGVCDGNSVCVECIQTTDCTGDETCCDNACIDTFADSSNCGACGTACVSFEICCNGSCVDTGVDTLNCGGCGLECVGSDACCDGICRDIYNDIDYCGGCDIFCGPGQECCDGSCIDTFGDDPSNCGGCGFFCDTLLCLDGMCVECLDNFGCAFACVDNFCQDCFPDFETCSDDSECCSGYCSGTCYTP